jgi:hypothetical protein
VEVKVGRQSSTSRKRAAWYDSGEYTALLVAARLVGLPQERVDEFNKLGKRGRYTKRSLFDYWVEKLAAREIVDMPANWLKWESKNTPYWPVPSGGDWTTRGYGISTYPRK